jgi:predicted nucleic acid-binding protein
LAGVGHLDLLPILYGNIWIPEQVRDEYAVRAATSDLQAIAVPWIIVHPVTIEPELQALSGFGSGEAAAISLAQASRARLILLDDKRARRVAQARGFLLSGTLGVLVRARQQGHLAAIRPVLDLMLAQGRYVSPALRASLLQTVGEREEDP